MGKDHLLSQGLPGALPKKRGASVFPATTRAVPAGFALVFSLALAASPLAPQDAVELWGAWVEWSGKDAESFKGGYALGAAYVADVGWPMDLGLDVLFARFDAEQLTKIVDEFEASVVLRRWLPGGGAPVRPYLGARAGYTRLSADYETLQLEQNGGMAGLTLGAVLPTGKTLAPTVELEAMRIWYADTNIFLEGENIPQTGGSAWRLFFRVGVTFGSGWERRGR